jgi:ketosteroid isomerase-like protein
MTPTETVRAFVASINAHDVAGLAARVTPDHRFVDSLGTVLTGRDAVRDGWRQYFQIVPDYRIDVIRSFVDNDDVVLLGLAGGTYSRNGQLNPADKWETPAAWRALVRGRLVAEWQVYADNEPIRKRMARPSA